MTIEQVRNLSEAQPFQPYVRQSRTRWLLISLAVLALVFIVRGILASLPHEPCFYVLNESFDTFKDQRIRSTCGDLELPALTDGQSARLFLRPRAGCVYQIDGSPIDGDRLLYLIELARDRKADVQIRIGIDYVDVDLTSNYKLW